MTGIFSNYSWQTITLWGDAILLLPFAAVATLAMHFAYGWKQVSRWLATLVLALTLVVVSKLAYFGWNIGSQAIDFTGFSGHTTLSAAILPIIFYLLLVDNSRASGVFGLIFGAIAATLIGISRVKLGCHSVSEVVTGLILGGAVSISTFRMLHKISPGKSLPRYSSAGSLIALSLILYGQMSPFNDLIMEVSVALSGHDCPFTRNGVSSCKPG